LHPQGALRKKRGPIRRGRAPGACGRTPVPHGTSLPAKEEKITVDGSWMGFILGQVRIRLEGGNPETFLNLAAAERIPLWNIRFSGDGKLEFGVAVSDFFRLRPVLRRSGAKPRILEKKGLPFQWARIFRRKAFAFGMAGFVVALYLLSTLIWSVEAQPTEHITREQILQAAKAEGLAPLQWSLRLPDTSELARRLARRLPDAAWVGVTKHGTRVDITVVESTKPEDRPLESPRDLVASADAVVTRIVAESGKPVVRANERVRKGDVLISGTIGEGGRTKRVVSRGTVHGLVWHEYDIVSPLVRKVKTYTGAYADRSYLLIGNRALQISGYGREPFDRSETKATVERLKWRKWVLPLGSMEERELEVQYTEERLTPAEAKEAGLAAARAELLLRFGADARIRAEKILHEQTEGGKVRLHVLFEVEQSIAVERPIVGMPERQGE